VVVGFVILQVVKAVGWCVGVFDCADVEPALSTGSELKVDKLVVCPFAQCVTTDSQGLRCDSGTNKLSRLSMPVVILDHLYIQQVNIFGLINNDV
jgi:hypothetical protein